MSASFTPVTSPTCPKSIGSGPPPATTRGGRFTALIVSALAPCSPTGFAPAATSAEHRSTFTFPATVIFITSSVSASVMRRPATICGVCPSFFCSSVACGPPPCTTTTCRPAARISATSAAIAAMCSPWTTSPPSLRTTYAPVLPAAFAAAVGHGYPPTSSSVVRSSQPSIRFIDWIACPAPPLIRLSVTLKHATTRLPSFASPT